MKNAYHACAGFRTAPDLIQLITTFAKEQEIASDEAEVLDITEEPRQTVFGRHLYEPLKTECEDFIDMAGFGVGVVHGLASRIFHNSVGDENDETVGEMVPLVFEH